MYLIRTRKLYAFLCLILASGATAYSQCTGTAPCETAFDETFTGNRGNFQLGESFTYNTNQLRSENKGGQTTRTLDTLHSGYFTAPTAGSTLTYRFALSAQNQGGSVSSYRILARYGTGTNDVVLLCSGATLVGGSPCFNYTVDPALAGKKFRFEFIFSISGTGNQARIGFDNFATNAPDAANQFPLPVSFTGFEGKKTKHGIQLTWNVAGEINVKAYNVERSSRGNTGFTSIGSVPATGASSYAFTDASSGSGAVFYRIKNVDGDGSFKYSSTISFNNDAAAPDVRVLPTVVSSKTSVEHGAAKGTETIMLSTADGRVVRRVQPAVGSVKTTVDMSNLRPGLYLLKWSDGRTVETTKIVKQ